MRSNRVVSRAWAVCLAVASTTGRASPDDIHDAVRAYPGLTVWELKNRTGRSWGAIYHHLDRLQKAGDIRIVSAGRRRVIVPSSSPLTPAEVAGTALIRGASAEQIARAIARGEAHTVAHLAGRVGMSQRAVYYHVRQLIAAGLVTSGSLTRRRDLRATPLLLAVVDRAP